MPELPSPFQPPIPRDDIPRYPQPLQLIRVTATQVAGPAGFAQVAGSSVLGPTLYVAFTQQMRDDGSLLPRDREPCLADDVNGLGLASGFYLGRLANSFKSLPVYEIVGTAFGGSSSSPPAPSAPKIIQRIYTANDTWNKLPGLSFIDVWVQAGGGAGGGTALTTGSYAVSNGGSGGGWSYRRIKASLLNSTETVIVGAGGVGSAGVGGTSGGESDFRFPSPLLTATGGTGGSGQAETPIGGRAASGGPSGGVGSGGDINGCGGDGGPGFIFADSGVIVQTGYGGSSLFSGSVNGAGAGVTFGNGNSPNGGYGGGGSGSATNSVTHRAGGNGGGGVVIVKEYYGINLL